MLDHPTFQDVLKAKRVISRYLPRTPLYHYPSLSRLLDAEVYIRHENHQPIGAFKVRGGVNLLWQLGDEEKRRGVITASTGNHGQSIAYAARLFGVRAIIAMPYRSNPGKVEAIENLGAEILFQGVDFDEARLHAEEVARQEGYRYVHPANEPLLIAGVATETLEILEELPEVEVLIIPVGGGSGASGACIVAKTVNPGMEVIAVQAEKAPAAYLSWKAHRFVEAKMETAAEGLATRVPFELTMSILWDALDDFILVSEEEIEQAMVLMIEKTHNLVEGAGAAPLAAALKIKERLRGRKVVLIQSGGNASVEQLTRVLRKARGGM